MGVINVFVYGTLKPGGTYHREFCTPYLNAAQPAQGQGLLYDLPHLGYPTMTLGNGWVMGYLLTLDQQALAGLDNLEGYCPPDQMFQGDNYSEGYTRQRLAVFDRGGQPLTEAWVYVMDTPPPGAIGLPTGHWPLP